MGLNKEQQAAVDCNASKILCLASAGCGKTKTMLARIERLVREGVDPKRILALTFTNAAAFEMKERYKLIPNLNMSNGVPEFRTFHSFCYSLIIKDQAVRSKLGYAQIPSVCDDAEFKEIKQKVKLQLNCKLTADQLDGENLYTRSEKDQYELFKKALIKELRTQNVITFDIMCYNVCALFDQNDSSILQYKNKYLHLFCDECQDTDVKQVTFIESFPSTTHRFLVGDVLQCQPAGTLVKMCDGSEKPIEEINVGDKVVTYKPSDGRYNQSIECGHSITQVGKRFATNIVEVSTLNHKSRYTKDHLTYCKIHYEGNEQRKCIYLMCNSQKGWWRIGTCSLFINGGNDFGPKGRLACEGGDKVWILDICSTEGGQSWLVEQTAAFRFGIPDTTWEFSNCHNYFYTEESLSELYQHIPDIEERAKRCLEYYGRDINYPFFDRTIDKNRHMSKLHMFEIRVGNLIPKLMDLVVPTKFVESRDKYRHNELHNTYEQIISITNCDPGWVYSLDVDKWHNYIADGILTHNCIYQFRNCTNDYIKSIIINPEWTVLKLFTNYRSTHQIVDYANKFSKSYSDPRFRIDMAALRDGDQVTTIYGSRSNYANPVCEDHLDKLVKYLNTNKVETAVLCRSNREVAAVKSRLTDENIQFSSRAKATDNLNYIDASLSNEYTLEWLSTKLDAKDYSNFIRLSALTPNPDIHWFLSTYGNREVIKHYVDKITQIRVTACAKDKSQEEKFYEMAKILRVKSKSKFTGDETTSDKALLEMLRDQVQEIEDCQIYVGTIHSSKGLEYDTVYVMGVDDKVFPLGDEEMNNLFYVAVTRAKNHLYVFRR